MVALNLMATYSYGDLLPENSNVIIPAGNPAKLANKEEKCS